MDNAPHGLPGPIPTPSGTVDDPDTGDRGQTREQARAKLPGANEPRPAPDPGPDAGPEPAPARPGPAVAPSPALPGVGQGLPGDAQGLPGDTPSSPGKPAVAAPLYVTDLTDEELQALDPQPAEDRLVVLPWFDSLTEAEQETAVVTAFRGLVARGLATAPTTSAVEEAIADAERRGATEGTLDIGIDAKIEQVLSLRRSARRIVVAQRTTAGRTDSAYFYAVDDELGLVELVQPKGLHTFSALGPGGLSAALADYVTLPTWEGGSGEPVVISAEQAATGEAPPEVIALLAQAEIQVQFVVRHAEEDPEKLAVCAVHTGPQALLVGRVEPGSGTDVRLDHVTRDELVTWLDEQAGWAA